MNERRMFLTEDSIPDDYKSIDEYNNEIVEEILIPFHNNSQVNSKSIQIYPCTQNRTTPSTLTLSVVSSSPSVTGKYYSIYYGQEMRISCYAKPSGSTTAKTFNFNPRFYVASGATGAGSFGFMGTTDSLFYIPFKIWNINTIMFSEGYDYRYAYLSGIQSSATYKIYYKPYTGE